MQLRHQTSALYAPLSSAHISTCCVVSAFSERCYETIHLRYYDIGESWGRIHLRNVEQCTCAAGEIECERVRYTSKTNFELLLFCPDCVILFLCWLLLLKGRCSLTNLIYTLYTDCFSVFLSHKQNLKRKKKNNQVSCQTKQRLFSLSKITT